MPKGTSLYAQTETGDLVREFAARAGVGTGRFLEALVNWYGDDAANSLIEFRKAHEGIDESYRRHRGGKALPERSKE